MKKRKDWNTFFAIEKNLAYDSSMQTTKELSGLGLSAAFAKHSASLSFGALIRKQLAAWYLCPALLARAWYWLRSAPLSFVCTMKLS